MKIKSIKRVKIKNSLYEIVTIKAVFFKAFNNFYFFPKHLSNPYLVKDRKLSLHLCNEESEMGLVINSIPIYIYHGVVFQKDSAQTGTWR